LKALEKMKPLHANNKENIEPLEQTNPVPRVVVGLVLGLALWSAGYIFTQRPDGVASLGDGRDPETLVKADVVASKDTANGMQLFTANCQACHQANGQGLSGVFPPLAGSEWVLGDEKVLSQILLHGLSGKIEVLGKTYQGSMPAFGSQLSDSEMAAVLTHVRSQWGNKAQPIAAEVVATGRAASATRSAPWTGTDEIKTFIDSLPGSPAP
jgi:mono/diheme cytochrome c family protein